MSLAGETVKAKSSVVRVHPFIVRVTHWLNAIAIIIMIGSGWRIYKDEPIFEPGLFPDWATWPEWATIAGNPHVTYAINSDAGFGNALLWHFAGMWLLVASGIIYLLYGIFSGRFYRKLFPITPRAVFKDIVAALTFHLSHDDIRIYNAVQRVMYLGIMVVIALSILSGLAIWKPVQFQNLTWLFYDFQGARLVHFICMNLIILFMVVHISLALLVPATLVAMVTGGARIKETAPESTPAPAE